METYEQLTLFDNALDIVEDRHRVKTVELREAFSDRDIVDVVHDPVHGSYIVLAERKGTVSEGFKHGFKEMGYAYPSPWSSWTRDEHVPELRDKVGIRTYYDMKRADGTVRGMLRTLKTPIQSAHWYVKPASNSAIDVEIAAFVEDNLFNRLNTPWDNVIENALLMCDYGYSPIELVWDIGEDGKIYLKKLAPRHPLDVREWLYDGNGGPRALVIEGNEVNGFVEVAIPIDKLAVFVLEQEGGDMRGISTLRSAYKHYYYKDILYKIDCVDEKTEIFTSKGWKKYNEINIGDKTLSINTKTGLSEWNDVEAVHKQFGTHDMTKMDSRVFSAMSTSDHRWWVRNKRSHKWSWKTTDTLSTLDQIPKSTLCNEIPTEPKYTDEFVEMVAWIWTEGSVHNGSFYVDQSHEVNYHNVLEIRRALRTLSPNPTAYGSPTKNKYWCEDINISHPDMTQFRVGAELSREFWKVFLKHKIVDPEFILSLTKAQLKLFIDTSILADGNDPKYGLEPCISQKNREQLFAVEMACILLGITTSLRKYDYSLTSATGRPHWRLQILRKNTYSPLYAANQAKYLDYKKGMKITKEKYIGTVWCVSTKNGNWLARRNGSIYYTGNSIQKERHGIGVPIVTLPMGFTARDREVADELGRNLRVNERAHVTLPDNWKLEFAKLEGQPVDCLTSINHHDKKIMSNVLVPFLDDPNAKPDSMDMFYKSTRYIAKTISNTFNHHVIRKLKDMNFSEGGYPKLSARRIGEWTDLRTWSFAMRNFVGAGMVTPDDKLEAFVREAADAPPLDAATARSVNKNIQNSVEVPEAPKPTTGRQKPLPKVNSGQANLGTDRSG